MTIIIQAALLWLGYICVCCCYSGSLASAFSPATAAAVVVGNRCCLLLGPTTTPTPISSKISFTGGNCCNERHRYRRNNLGPLYSGRGIAPTYSWAEECFEIEITVKVPKETRANDISFKAKPNSIDLRLKKNANAAVEEEGDDDEVVLLDPDRKLRGRVVLDGTYWIISDPEKTNNDDDDDNTEPTEPHRVVTVTIEKQIRTPKDDFDVIEYDWNGVYEDDEDEVSYRKYDEPEELNVREYAASMGVDIDNIDMNLVDKSMFTSGLNLTQSTFDTMKDAGLMTEVTEQTDGSEWITDKDGEQVPFSSMGKGVSKDEVQSAKKKSSSKPTAIPFLDTSSPWHKAVPAEKAKDVKEQLMEAPPTTSSSTSTSTSTSDDSADEEEKTPKTKEGIPKDAKDPIDTLTVAKLKEVLRARGLKVSGNKKELQERLRAEVRSMLESDNDNDNDNDESFE